MNKPKLKLYNQFPPAYKNLNVMENQLEIIKFMGFNAVWVNPLFRVGTKKKKKVTKGQLYNQCPESENYGSLYATTVTIKNFDDDDFINPLFLSELEGIAHKDIIMNYTTKAKQQGLEVLFDLVLNHVAADSPLVNDHKAWFKDYTSGDLKGQLKIHGVNEQGIVEKNNCWDDVALFNYDKENIEDIFKNYWEPFLDKMLKLGFTGIRVDAAGLVNSTILEKCLKYWQQIQSKPSMPTKVPIVFAESLNPPEREVEEIKTLEKQKLITHITNPLYWVPTVYGGSADKKQQDPYTPFNSADDWANRIMGAKRPITRNNESKDHPYQRGTVGFVSSHDEEPWCKVISENIHTQNPNIDINKGLKEKIALIAFASDGGWYMMSGDERKNTKRMSVFSNERENCILYKNSSDINLENEARFIMYINKYVLADQEELGELGELGMNTYIKRLEDIKVNNIAYISLIRHKDLYSSLNISTLESCTLSL